MPRKKLKNTKRPVTAKELAKRFGCTPRTVVNVWAMDRADYEANSYSRTKPWESLGISRMTWYNYNKPSTIEELEERRAGKRKYVKKLT